MNAFDLIKGFEGFRSTPYWDVNAYRTGYGSDTVTLADGRIVPVTQGMSVTEEDAQRDLERRVNSEFIPRAVAKVGPEAWGRMSEPQRAALASITYNYGDLPDSVAEKIMSGDMAGASQAIAALGSHNGGVNAERRSKEASIFAGGQMPGGGQNALAPQAQQPEAQNTPFIPQMAQMDPGAFARPRNALAFAPLQFQPKNALGQL